MKEWLGEPVPGYQFSGRGILRNFINKVVIWNTLIVLMAKQKNTGDFPYWEKKKSTGEKICQNEFG